MAQLEVRRREIAEALSARRRPGVLERRRVRVGRGDGRRRRRHRDRRRLGAAGARDLRPLRRPSSRARPRSSGCGSPASPTPAIATVHGGGLIASGPTGADRSPVPWAPPGLHLTGLEGAGEVQTPLTGHPAALLQIGDLVWFRHAKSGELFEHVRDVHLVRGDDGRRGGAVLPRLRPCLLTARPGGRRAEVAGRVLPAPADPRAPGAWSASTGRPGPARPRWPPRSPTSLPARRWCTATSCSRAGAGCPGWRDRSSRLLDPLAAGRARPVAALGLARRRLGRDARRRAGRPARARGRRVLVAAPSPTGSASLVWVEADPTSGSSAGLARDGEAHAPALGAVARRRGRSSSPGSGPGTTPTLVVTTG